jgi:hypothetical protein
MPIVSVPHEFFIKERDSFYAHWQTAFFRELFQNSIDAGATKINILIFDNMDNTVQVKFLDNGSGMTRDVLENVYFALGRSTKEGTDSVGGFGRARILTNFSMKSYEIHTQGWRANGSGASYEVEEAEDHLHGCLQDIQVEDTTKYYLQLALDSYLAKASFSDCEVFIGGTEWKPTFRRGTFIKAVEDDTERKLADLHIAQRDKLPEDEWEDYSWKTVVVRVKGHPLFEVYTSSPIQATIELEPSLARDIITSNRDGFNHTYNRVFEQLISQFNGALAELVKPHREQRITHIHGTGKLIISAKSERNAPRILRDFLKNHLTEGLAPISGQIRLSSQKRISVALKGLQISGILPDMMFRVQCENSKKLAAVPWWDPQNWEVELLENRVNWKGSKNQVFTMLAWKLCLEEALDILYTHFPRLLRYQTLSWTPGFYINDVSTEASVSGGFGQADFYVDPLNDDGTPRFNPQDRMSMKRLMSLAKHEVAHVVETMHNERYAIALTDIDSFYDEQTVFKRIQAL